MNYLKFRDKYNSLLIFREDELYRIEEDSVYTKKNGRFSITEETYQLIINNLSVVNCLAKTKTSKEFIEEHLAETKPTTFKSPADR